MRRMPECLGRLVKTAPTARDDRGISGKESIVPHRSRTEPFDAVLVSALDSAGLAVIIRSEEHTSELQSLMRISYAVFCLKKKKNILHNNNITHTQDRIT